MPQETRRVTLAKAERDSAVAKELIALLLDLSDDGQVTRDEMNRLRHWLEVDRGVEFPACAFLYEIVETIAADGEVTDAELDRLMIGIERVLPNDVRSIAREKRRQHREARKIANAAIRGAARAKAAAKRERTRVLHRGDFVIAGVRYSERRKLYYEGNRKRRRHCSLLCRETWKKSFCDAYARMPADGFNPCSM